MKSIGLSLLLATTLLACEKEEEIPAMEPEPSLFTADELARGNVFRLEADAIGATVDESSDLRAHSDDSSPEPAGDDCVGTKLDALVFSADETNARIRADLNLVDCLKGLLGNEATITKADLRIAFWTGCEESDLKDLDGQTLGSSGSSTNPCEEEGEVRLLMNIDFTFGASIPFDVGDGVVRTGKFEQRVLSAYQTVDGGPCVRVLQGANWAWDNSCRIVERSVVLKSEIDGRTDTSSQGKENYVALGFVDIVQSGDATRTWFESGRFDAVVNNWSGTVTYTEGYTAPTWTMTDGTSTRSGIVGQSGDAHPAPGNPSADRGVSEAIAQSVQALRSHSWH